jgi:hypothetical protein
MWSRAVSPGASSGRLSVRAAALLCVAVTAGCASAASSSSPAAPGSPSAPASSTPATSAASTPAAAPPPTLTPPATAPAACATSALLVRLGVAQGYAGGADYVIDFTNQSGAACTMYGYPGVSLVTGPPYRQIGLAAQRDNTAPVKLVTLIPGAMATAELQVVDAHNFTPQICRPVSATHLRVYPPNQTAPVYLASTSFGCAERVQTLFIAAVQASSHEHPLTNASGQGG